MTQAQGMAYFVYIDPERVTIQARPENIYRKRRYIDMGRSDNAAGDQ